MRRVPESSLNGGSAPATVAVASPRAPVSVCVIVRDEPKLEQALRSVRDHVAEIVLVNTGPNPVPDAARALADVYDRFDGCNDPATGLIEDFALARQHSFDLATQPWIMWMDADDEVTGAENLTHLIVAAATNWPDQAVSYMCPYEYAYDGNGNCICRHYRERLFFRADRLQWVNPVHEVVIPRPGTGGVVQPEYDGIVWKHRRGGGHTESGRNLRILRRWIEKHGTDDARMLYYLGIECADNGLADEAIVHLSKYVAVSGWDDERVMACLKLVNIFLAKNEHGDALRWAFQCISLQEKWDQGYFALARTYYAIALKGGPSASRNWQRCVHFAQEGLKRPEAKTVLFINPRDRSVHIHEFLNYALNMIGDVDGALASCEAALAADPTNEKILGNKKRYAGHLARIRAQRELDILRDCDWINAEAHAAGNAAVLGQQAIQWADYHRPEAYPRGVTDADFPVARVTPHPQAWGIPEAFELQALPLRMSEAQLEAMTLALWHEYMLHDEIVAALALLRDAPYRVKHSVNITKACELTEKTIAWMGDPVDAQRVNTPEQPEIENGVALPAPLTGAMLGRFQLVRDALRPGDKVLDLGCFDGVMTNRLGLLGFDVTGIDLCKGSVALANRKAAEFNTGAKHIVGYFQDLRDLVSPDFDTVTCCDTYEHVLDPVADLIRPAQYALRAHNRQTRGGDPMTGPGRMLVVTPYGSWMRGAFIPWAHPWRWAPDLNKPWICDESRAHVVAPTPWTVAENFRASGWYVQNSYVVPCVERDGTKPDTPGQGNVFCEAVVLDPRIPRIHWPDTRTTGPRPQDIAIVCGAAWEPWTPRTARETGIGGSETAVIEIGKELVARGHKVRVYTDCGVDGEGIYDGVEYYETSKLAVAKGCDVLVAWRNAQHLEAMPAELKLLWVHDIYAMTATNALLLKADRVLGLSKWHCDFLRDYHNLAAEHVVQTRNGIDLKRFDQVVERDPFKVVYSSSPDRGLQALLQMWPTIKERVPQASLHIFYGFENWKKSAAAQNNDGQLRVIAMLERTIAELAPLGVVMRARVNQMELAREFLSAGALLYPTWFSETNFITGYESQAAGLRIVTSPIAAVTENIGDRGVLIEGDWLSPDYQARFTEAAVDALTRPDDGDRAASQAYAREHFPWAALAAEWESMMLELIDAKAAAPLVPYRHAHGFERNDTGHAKQQLNQSP